MIRAIMFDFFDVFRTDGYNRWLKAHGLKRTGPYLEASEKHDRGIYSDKQFFQDIAAASGEDIDKIEAALENNNEFNHSLVDYLKTLKNIYKLALISNSSSAYLRTILAENDLTKYFDEIVISSEIGLIKPEPEIFEYAMQKLGVEPHECIFIDDNTENVATANGLGIQGLAYTSVAELRRRIEDLTA